MSLLTVFNRIGEIGISPHHDRWRARTLRHANHIGILFAAMALPVLTFATAVLPAFAAVAAMTLVGFLSAPVFNKAGLHLLARVVPILSADLLVVASDQMFGPTLQAHTALFVVATVPFVLFDERERLWLVLLESLSAGLYLLLTMPAPLQLTFLPHAELGAGLATALRAVYVATEFSGLGLVLGIFFWQLRANDEQQAGSLTNLQSQVAERARAEGELVRAKELAEAGARAKSEFLATMSHELRTPMNAVLGATSLLRESALEQEQHDMLQTIETAGQSLLTLLNDVLDLSVADLGGLELHGQVFSPHDVVEGTVLALGSLAEKKGLDLALETRAGLPAEAVGDVTRIRQTVSKLLGNALKFTSQGFVRVILEGVSNSPTEVGLRVSVMDSGIGIAKHLQEGVFEMFSQSDSSTTRAFGGTGLGLALSQRLVHRMGGRIGFQSIEGTGSTFWFEVPVTARFGAQEAAPLRGQRIVVLARGRALGPALRAAFTGAQATLVDEISPGVQVYVDPRDQSAEELAAVYAKCRSAEARLVVMGQRDDSVPPEATVLPRLSRRVRLLEVATRLIQLPASQRMPRTARHLLPVPVMKGDQIPRVLLVEDNAVNQMIVRTALAKMGIDCTVAGNGRVALEELARKTFDLVIMDIQMPVMDGYEATRAIRAGENGGPRLPVVALTANATLEDRENAFSAGMDAFLTKPVRIEELRVTVMSLTERHRRAHVA